MSIEALLYGFAMPLVVAGAAYFLLYRFGPGEWSKRAASAVALVGGFVIGYGLLGLGQWTPKYYWHWLPYVALLTVVAGPLLAGSGRLRMIGSGVCLFITLLAGWLLVPTWPHLEPSRFVYIGIWAPAVFALALLLDPLTQQPLSDRIGRGLLSVVLTGVMFMVAAMIFLSGSAKFTQVAGAACGAILGVAISSSVCDRNEPLRGIAFSFATLACSLLLVAQVDSHSDAPLVSYVVIPFAPLTLWIAAFKPVSQWQGWPRWLAMLAPPLALLIVALGIAAVMVFGSES